MVVIEIDIKSYGWKGREKLEQQSYLKEITPVIKFHFRRAVEATLADRPNDPIRYISTQLAKHVDRNGYFDDDESVHRGIETGARNRQGVLLKQPRPLMCLDFNSTFCQDILPFVTSIGSRGRSSFIMSTLLDPTIESLRDYVYSQNSATRKAKKLLLDKLDAGPPTSRTGYLKSLEELIGPNKLQTSSRREWMLEWRQMYMEYQNMEIAKKTKITVSSSTVENNGDMADMKECVDSDNYDWEEIESEFEEMFEPSIVWRTEQGWERDAAEAYTWLSSIEARNPMGRALRECSSRYAKSTYALNRALGQRKAACPDKLPPMAYRNLKGYGSLCDDDEKWAQIEEPDPNGFRGLTTTVLCRPVWGGNYFNAQGFVAQGSSKPFEESPIVRFLSEDDDEHGFHSGLSVYTTSTAFPPNTLFALKRVYEPGTWDGPGGIRINQRLLEVTATYRLNKSDSSDERATGGPKLCGDIVMLSYASRRTYIRGLSDVLDKPLLTMEQEWSRNMS